MLEILDQIPFMNGKTKCTPILKIHPYTLICREATFEPWIAAYYCKIENDKGSWANGNYFNTAEDALRYILSRTEK